MKKARGALALCLALCMAMAALPVPVSARQYSDVGQNHWAADKINEWSDLGYMQGYPDGTFRPEGDITRAEFVKITNNAFGFIGAGSINFSDVTTAFWGYNDIRTASSMGYINGYPNGTFQPNGNITRQEAAKIICVILGLEENTIATYSFTDYTNMDDWARGFVGAVYANKIMGRYSDGTFKARQKLTRAECVEGLWNAAAALKGQQAQKVEDLAVTTATYVANGGKTVSNLSINYAGDVTVENLTIQGDVSIGAKVADYTVTLKNCTIAGTLYLDYGNLVLDGVTLAGLKLSSAKTDRTVGLRNSTTVQSAQTDRSVTIDQSAVTGTGKGIQLLYVGDSVAATTTLKGGVFPKVVVSRKDQSVVLLAGSITRLECDYSGLDVLLGQDTQLTYAQINAAGAVLEGPGNVAEADLGVRGTVFQRDPGKLSGQNPTYSTTGDWRLSVTVTDVHTGRAIAGAKVTLGAGWATGTTNNAGLVQFNDIPYRDITYTVSAADYKAATDTVKAEAGFETHRALAVALAPGGSWQATLTVVDSWGGGIPGAYACIYSATGALVQTSSVSAAYTSGSKASDGVIVFDGLATGTYTYKVFAPGYAASDSRSFTISGRDNPSAGTITLYQNRVEIRLYSSYDSTTQITSFRLRDPANAANWLTANSAGVVTLEGLASGTYSLTIQLTGTDKDNYILDTPATATTTVRLTVSDSDYAASGAAAKSITLTPNAAYTYTVNVTNLDGSARIENATLKLTSALTGYSRSITLTASDGGRVYFTDVPMSKDYVLTISSGGYGSYSKTGLTVDGANLFHQASLTGLRTVTLYIQDISGNGVQGMKVSLSGTGAPAAQTTDSVGRVVFQNVPEGTYTVTGEHSTLQLAAGTQITVYESVSRTLIAQGIQVTFTLTLQRKDGGSALPATMALILRGTSQSYSRNSSGGSFTFTVPMGVYDISLPGGYALATEGDFINLSPSAQSAHLVVLITGP